MPTLRPSADAVIETARSAVAAAAIISFFIMGLFLSGWFQVAPPPPRSRVHQQTRQPYQITAPNAISRHLDQLRSGERAMPDLAYLGPVWWNRKMPSRRMIIETDAVSFGNDVERRDSLIRLPARHGRRALSTVTRSPRRQRATRQGRDR